MLIAINTLPPPLETLRLRRVHSRPQRLPTAPVPSVSFCHTGQDLPFYAEGAGQVSHLTDGRSVPFRAAPLVPCDAHLLSTHLVRSFSWHAGKPTSQNCSARPCQQLLQRR